ncbi:hypothetical protein KL86DES1_10807 [uncultured Desulfovibrio sp.]|uniref:Uncharacterized protein n=1 Tax=uncultured Desulfovibrio sp. TaxID=167968 RepID=A0A212L0I8_9BACT|nr:hypothetical protein KL86DES1_10807 [uncultured Desulfovibrio sp.]VZH32679.1 conserved protein of unknown function [Desulfovibrio sp. 86]
MWQTCDFLARLPLDQINFELQHISEFSFSRKM